MGCVTNLVVDLDAHDDRLSIQSDDWQLIVHAPAAELVHLARIREARWDRRSSLRVGTCAGEPVF